VEELVDFEARIEARVARFVELVEFVFAGLGQAIEAGAHANVAGGARANAAARVVDCEALVHRGFLGLGSKESLQFGAHADLFEACARDQRLYRKLA
jgi:hypothetical protein